ncbi:MAG TPA: hypothetical protein VH413_05005 [Verrucomicrobiae bacterium]|jgi:hypothetical protein|nr:hypothetical protein [Verrucomicrobiae bacterium]
MEWIGLSLNLVGIGSAAVAPFAVVLRHNKVATVAALTALGYTTLTIVGLIQEWYGNYWDLGSDLLLFGFLAALTTLSGAGSLVAIKNRKSN